MRYLINCIALLAMPCFAFSSNIQDIELQDFKTELNKRSFYDKQKEAAIDNYKSELQNVADSDLHARFRLFNNLYDEYKSYKYDSAYVYAKKMYALGERLQNDTLKDYSRVKLAFTLLSSGKFKEAFSLLESVHPQLFDKSTKLDYYSVVIRANLDIVNYNNDPNYADEYRHQANRYIDSAIALSTPGTYSNAFLNSYKMFINHNDRKALTRFLKLSQNFQPNVHERAILASILSEVYIRLKQPEQAKRYLIAAVIYDVKTATKETLALFHLAELSSASGDVDNAYLYIQQALKDAEFYGARQRQVEISAILPLLSAQKLSFIESQKTRFFWYLLSTALLTLVVVAVSVILYKQLQKLKSKEKIIKQTYVDLERINNRLIEVNEQLTQANNKFAEDAHIKEEYIGYFFNLISGYILKLEKLKTSIEAKIIQHKFEQIQPIVEGIVIHKERDMLFATFDKVFLKIFPRFIPSFNALLKKEDQIWPRGNEVLTTDLRIFALIRLGIHDSESLAKILQYSAKTVYVYKMRIKAKSIYSHEQFDEMLMKIEAVESPQNVNLVDLSHLIEAPALV